jgi:hypothetical protein
MIKGKTAEEKNEKKMGRNKRTRIKKEKHNEAEMEHEEKDKGKGINDKGEEDGREKL